MILDAQFRGPVINNPLMSRKAAVLGSLAALAMVLCSSAANGESDADRDHPKKVALVIHGGAGNVRPEALSEELASRYESSLEATLREGYSLLAAGASSIDVVEAVIRKALAKDPQARFAGAAEMAVRLQRESE